jgi:hypothetical protein
MAGISHLWSAAPDTLPTLVMVCYPASNLAGLISSTDPQQLLAIPESGQSKSTRTSLVSSGIGWGDIFNARAARILALSNSALPPR